jgi:hypothetical protein
MEKLAQVIETSDFLSLVSDWKQKSNKAAMLKLEAKRDFCNAYFVSEGKNETARTSDAELRSHDAALEAEHARIEAKAAKFLVQYALGNSTVR